jgi:predicted Rossmann-fold nucleotide-binding protein
LFFSRARLTRLEVTSTIPQNKARMSALADGYVALPGGYRTPTEAVKRWMSQEEDYFSLHD